MTTICPGFVRTELTAGNPFPMPFMIDAGEAARSICRGLERERTVVVFPAPMALLMKAARLVPARAWDGPVGSHATRRAGRLGATCPAAGRSRVTGP